MDLTGLYNNFILPIIRPLIQPIWGQIAGAALGALGGGSSAPSIDVGKLREMQSGTQGLVDEQLGMSRQLMDPHSAVNQTMKKMMAQRAMESGQQAGTQAMKIAAMKGVSPGQAMMHQRMAQNQATGGVNQSWLQSLQGRFGQGLGLMGNMTQMQQGLDENLSNAYMQNVNAQQAAAAQGGGGAGGIMSALGGMGMNFGNIGSGKTGLFGGKDGFMSGFGTGEGALANMFGGGG